MVEQWNTDGGTVEQCWWNSVMEKFKSEGGTVMVEECGGTVKQCWWNSVAEQWNSDGGTVWLNSGTVIVEQCC